KGKWAKLDKKKQPAKMTKAKGNGVDTQSKVPNEQQQKTTSTDEGTGTIPGVPDVPPYESESDKDSWGDSNDKDNDDDDGDNDDDDDGNSDDHDDDKEFDNEFYEEEEEENIDDDETMYDKEDDEVIKEIYDDVNTGDPTQSSSVSSDFTSKLLNLDNPSLVDNEIASLMDTTGQHATVIPEITSSFTTTVPPPPSFLHTLQQEATLAPTPTTFITTTSTNPILKQTNQFAEAVSSIPGIIDSYLPFKMKEAVDVAAQLQTN
ncbi:hypothetical protein Tco_1274360, partial [Tanacetum coccineum]